MLNQIPVSRSAKILSAFIGDEIPQEILEERVRAAFAFPAPVAQLPRMSAVWNCSTALRLHLKTLAGALWRRC